MDDYISYFDLLANASAAVSAVVGYSLLGLAVTWLSGAWISLLLIPWNSGVTSPRDSHTWLWLHPAILAAGWGTLIALSMASLFLTKGVLASELLTILVAGAGCVGLWRRKACISSDGSAIFAVVGLIALAMGLWQHVPTALPVTDSTGFLVFSDLHKDLPIHVTMAGLIKESGLPLINMTASPGYPYGGLAHIGHTVAIASYSSMLGISLYTASTVNFVIAMLLTGWCALALASSRSGINLWYRLIAVLATLVIGQFTFPWLHDPTNPKGPLITGMWVASRSYWNISQAISIALTMGGLLLLDHYCQFRQQYHGRLLIFLCAVALITIAGLVKPSLVIFLGPALIIWLAISGARMVEFLAAVVILQAGVMTYFVPRFLHALPTGAGWSFGANQEQWVEVGLFLWHACLGVGVMLMAVVANSIATGWRDREWQILDLCAIAFAGSVLFALLFREDRFVGFFVMQPNIWWGIAACVVLLVPVVCRELPQLVNPGSRFRWLVMVALAIGAIQVFNGLHVALAYPIINQRTHKAVLAETLDAARNTTPPGTRFALDPSLEQLDLRPFLSRPSLLRTTYTSPDGKRAYADWVRFIKSGTGDPPIDRLDSVVLHINRRKANRYFDELGWRSTRLNEQFTLWQQAGTMPSQ